jgi:uncharacterized protein (TIGR03437 family)
MTRFALGICLIAGCFTAAAQVSATIDIDTTHTTPLNANFSGFNDEVVFPAEYYDYRLNNLAAQLSPGWVRYPSGLFSDAFDWQTGLMVAAWAAEFPANDMDALLSEGVPWVAGKGGGSFVDAGIRANFLGAKLIVCVNVYTDTPQSAGAMAAFAKANHIPVAVWELGNEPYLMPSFFSSGADYVTKVEPYRDAIKAADPDAVVAVFFQDAGDTNANPPWDQAIANFSNKYWDAVTFHHYPQQTATTFTQAMLDDNGVLATKSNAFVTGYLATVNPAGTRFLISEFLPSNDGLGTGTSLTDGTLYGAVYAAEYVMRMSAVPSMLHVGPHALTGTRGVYAATTHYNDVAAAAAEGTSIDTLSLDFGFYTTAQPLGVAVLNGVLRNATAVDSTSVTGGATVTATGAGQIPALYAQAYGTATGQQSVVISNKSATPQQVTIRLNGSAVSGTLAIQFIGGADPSAVNTAANPNTVAIQTATSANPVTVPAYSVVRVDLNAPAVATPVNSASYAAGPVAPDEIVTLFGPWGASALTSIAVRITDSAGNSQVAPAFAVSAGLASIVLPEGLAAGPANFTVLSGSATLATGSMTIAGSASGLFSMNSDGAGAAAALAFRFSATSQVTPETAFSCDPSAARSCLPVPLSLGSATDTLWVSLYGTGIRGAASVQCFVAGQSVTVQYAGAASTPGLDQVNIAIPRSLAGTGHVLVYLVADGAASNAVSLSIQ